MSLDRPRRKSASTAAFLIAAVLAPRAADAATLEVPQDFATIQAALNAAEAGDTVDVSAGTYFEKVTFTNGGNAGSGYVTLRAAPGAPTRPVLDGTGVPGANMVLIDSKSYVRIEGFEIVHNLAVNDGSGVRVLGAGTNIEIVDNVIHEIRGEHAMGITVYATEPAPITNLLIDKNEIFDCEPASSEALTLNGNVSNFVVRDNLVRDVDNIGIDFIGGETDIQPDPDLVARDGLVRGNTVIRARSIYGGGFAGGIYVDGGRDIVIENNTVTESDLGIEIGAENGGTVTEGVIVRNNLLYRNDKAGLVFGGFKAGAGRASDNEFRGNTLYQNTVVGREAGAEAEIWIQYAENNVVEGNVVVAGDDNVFVASFAGSVGNVFDYNLYYSDAGAGSGEFTLSGAVFGGFSAWQSGTGQDGSSLSADPLLRDPETGDFHIDAASPAFDAGNPAYVPAVGETDLDGASRVSGAAVDIGADEASCGDGVMNPGEECDDSNQTSGDGCDVNCTVTACGNGILTAGTGEQCDDGNVAAGDCCSTTCAFEASGSTCDDDRVCTLADTCDGAGACVGSAAPDLSCTTPMVSGGARIKLMDRGADDRLAWKWGKGDVASFDDPTAGEDHALCLYVDDGGPSILLEALAESGSKWAHRGDGRYDYRDPSLLPDGLKQIQLRPGLGGKAKVKVKGTGSRLRISGLGLGPAASLSAQLRSASGSCFGATFTAPFSRNDASQLKATSD